MRSVEVASDRALVVVDRAEPVPGSGQVVVEVAFCGICGSDLHFRDVPALFPEGTVPGHEVAGRIVGVGDSVTGWQAGDRVCVFPFAQCGSCAYCLSGSEQVCPEAIVRGVGLGTGRPGGYAERMLVDESMLFALPDGIDDRAGTFVEPLAVAVRAVAKAELAAGERVAVLGAGPIGLLTAIVLRERGFEHTVLVSRNAARGEQAAALGLPVATLAEVERDGLTERLGGPPACVLECAGSAAAARLAVDLVAPLGRVVLVGIAMEPLDLSAPALVLKEAEIRGALAYRRADYAEAIALLAGGRVPTGELITGSAGLDDAEAMFQALTSRGNTHLKVLLQP